MGIPTSQPAPDMHSTAEASRPAAFASRKKRRGNGLGPGVLAEETFLEMLALERRRSERSRKPFLLMLLGLEKCKAGTGEGVLRAVAASTRETDITGWHQTDAVLGVIFTEIGDAAKETILETVRKKVTRALEAHVAPSQVEAMELSLYLYPDRWESHRPGRQDLAPLYPDLSREREASGVALHIKRAIDVVGSVLALVLLAPVFLAITLAIKLTSRGPVFFRQERLGQSGEPFGCYKFRTMHLNNDARIHKEYVHRLIQGRAAASAAKGAAGVYKITNDPRVTRVGRFLRRTSLDELPQFFNVLKGEMSLVGPRPPIPYELEAYDVWHRRRILEARPGITGLWQVRGRSRTTFDEMVRLDLQYARTWSLWLDFKILLATPRAVFSGKGAH